MPLNLPYTAWSYRVFRGKLDPSAGDHRWLATPRGLHVRLAWFGSPVTGGSGLAVVALLLRAVL
jgi:hypothetical protein